MVSIRAIQIRRFAISGAHGVCTFFGYFNAAAWTMPYHLKFHSSTEVDVSFPNSRRIAPNSRIQRVLLFPGSEIAVRFEMHFGMGIGETVGSRPGAIRLLPGVTAEQDDSVGHRIGQLVERPVVENL